MGGTPPRFFSVGEQLRVRFRLTGESRLWLALDESLARFLGRPNLPRNSQRNEKRLLVLQKIFTVRFSTDS